MSTSLFSRLPETAEMQLAKTVQEFQSQVGHRTVIQTPECSHAANCASAGRDRACFSAP